jgi:Ca-activated chloride channel family protein
MRRLLPLAALLASAAAAGLAGDARADGFLVPLRPDRPVRGDYAVTYHRVDVRVDGQKARIRVDQEFENLSSTNLEAEYVFPVPPGAMVSAVTLMVDGRGMEGRLLRAEEARRIYDDIVRRQKDPALVEYVGRDVFRASIFPIPPRGRRQLVLEYDHLLPKDGETIELVYPLNTEKFSARALQDVRVTVDIAAPASIGPVYSPSHEVNVARPDGRRALVTFQQRDVRPETDFLLYWTPSAAEVGATLLTHWPRGEDRGWFLFLASPSVPDTAVKAAAAREVVLVCDTSGSMAGEKIEQAKAALRQVIGGLSDGDRFNVITYGSGVFPMWDASQPATRERRDEAMRFVDGVRVAGGTNIDGALQAALSAPALDGFPRTVLFLTDGRPTMGETQPERILENVRKSDPSGRSRVFSFGVGVDLNTVLLDKLALQNHGVPTYVRPNEDVERKVAGMYEKIRHPVLTDVRVDFSGMSASEVLPAATPDLFRGGQVVVAGRYRKGGPIDVVVTGRDGAAGREFPYRLNAAGPGEGLRDDFPARVWAVRRIAELVDQVRLLGRREPELVNEIVALSTRFGILTEYTSYLADETADHGRFRENFERTLSRLGEAADAGAAGFAASANQEARREADRPLPAPTAPPPADGRGGGYAGGPPPAAEKAKSLEEAARAGLLKADGSGRDVEAEVVGGLRQVGNRAFYKRAQAWVDADVKDAKKIDETVVRWSPRFFELLATTTSLENARLAQSGDVLLVLQGRNVLVQDVAR